MTDRNTQSGFEIVGLIVVVLVVVIAGAVGWLAYNNFVKKPEPTVAKVTSIPKPSSTPQSHQNLITIKELGISIVVPDSLKDLTYTYETENVSPNGGKNTAVGDVNFSTATLTKVDSACSSDGIAPPLGGATKITGTYSDGAIGATWDGGFVKQLPDSFLTFGSPQATCFSDPTGKDQVYQKTITTEIDELRDALKNAKQL
jgi:hypothetical protein